MKRYLAYLLLCVLMLAGCNGSPRETTPTEPTMPMEQAHELVVDIYEGIMQRIYAAATNEEGLASLNSAQRAVYVIYTYDTCMASGGISSFLNSEDAFLTELLADCLDMVGAQSHKELYISLINEQPAFESYDEAFGKLPSLTRILGVYIQENPLSFKVNERG